MKKYIMINISEFKDWDSSNRLSISFLTRLSKVVESNLLAD